MGVKNNRSSVAVLDYFPKTERLALTELESGVGHSDKEQSAGQADEELIRHLLALRKGCPRFYGLAIHAPLSMPPYLELRGKKQPFPARSRDPQVKWMNEQWARLTDKPRAFVPYLQRPAEIYLRHLCTEKFPITDGFGSNAAPLAARMEFLKAYLPKPFFEVFPRATLPRLVSSLGFSKWIPLQYSDLDKGVDTREEFINQLLKKVPSLFIYSKDHESLVLNVHAFHAFLSALTGFLIAKDACERAPRDFPKGASWIHIPRTYIAWDKIFTAK